MPSTAMGRLPTADLIARKFDLQLGDLLVEANQNAQSQKLPREGGFRQRERTSERVAAELLFITGLPCLFHKS